MPETLIGGRYRLTRKISSGDLVRGLPDLWEATDSGDVYYIKLWRRLREQKSEIRGLWNREVRGLMRLQGYPGASELFARLVDLNVSDKFYYAVLEGGRRQVLSEMLSSRSRYTWLQNLAEPIRRKPIWDGLLRISEALGIIHNEGTLHRALSSSSILSGPDGQGDFRLSGFEWSLRVAGTDKGARTVTHRNKLLAPELDKGGGDYSPNVDWFDFGVLAAELFGTPSATAGTRDILRTNVKKLPILRGPERDLILQLLEEDPELRLNRSEPIVEAIKNIVRSLTTSIQTLGRDLILAVRLNPDRELSQMVHRASAGNAPLSDRNKQLAWITDDLKGDVRVIARSSQNPHFIVKGDKLEYRVKPWINRGTSTWEVGFCESTEPQIRSLIDDQPFGLGERRIRVEPFSAVHRNFRQVGDRAVPWDKQFAFKARSYTVPHHLKDVHDFFRVTQSLDTLITAAQICPVRIYDTEIHERETFVHCTPVVEAERNELAQFLAMPAPAEQLREWFDLGVEEVTYDEVEEAKRDIFTFLETKKIDSDAMPTKWLFDSASQSPDGPTYTFKTNSAINVPTGQWYLARNHEGTISQIRRRVKAIEDMRSHEDLLRILDNPCQAARVGTEPLPTARATIELDRSKETALSEIWATQPFFALQGPPGTGKTTLIKAFCDRLLNGDASAQILITAHSHHTVDDVRTKISKLFDQRGVEDRPILLRLGARQPTSHDLDLVTTEQIERLRSSPLAIGSPSHIRDRVEAMASDLWQRSNEATTDYRTFQLLVQDAANITFATSNSAELADLSERGRRFDWSIIEEAGKAHGFDMAIALQESHRLLLIGDHYQLKPFNTRLFTDLLEEPLRIKKAVLTGVQFAGGLVEQSVVEEEEDRRSFNERCHMWQSMVTLFGNLFRKCTDSDYSDVKPAATLTDQHRMHPDIAELVGRVFYPDSEEGTILVSPDETHEKFKGAPPFLIDNTSWLPQQRIVWCDVPWVQKKLFAKGESNGLYQSETEVEVLVRVLSEIKPRGDEECDVQILSPYKDQLSAIRVRINTMFDIGSLRPMFEKPFDLKEGKRMGASVDEFQGGEADVVIVSLVRNNGLPPIQSVGFLKEANRMNVLLSRAKHKMIIIGSWNFFHSRCDDRTSSFDEYAYIGDLMSEMHDARKANTLGWVEF